MTSPRGGELLRDAAWSRAAHGEEQAAFRAEALNERGGNDPSFFGHVRQRELCGAAALHDAGGGGEDFFVGSLARTGAHGGLRGRLAARTEYINRRLVST
jgi:hypothetical protein